MMVSGAASRPPGNAGRQHLAQSGRAPTPGGHSVARGALNHWQIASPKWHFDDATFDRTAASFDNPDHVCIVSTTTAGC